MNRKVAHNALWNRRAISVAGREAGGAAIQRIDSMALSPACFSQARTLPQPAAHLATGSLRDMTHLLAKVRERDFCHQQYLRNEQLFTIFAHRGINVWSHRVSDEPSQRHGVELIFAATQII